MAVNKTAIASCVSGTMLESIIKSSHTILTAIRRMLEDTNLFELYCSAKSKAHCECKAGHTIYYNAHLVYVRVTMLMYAGIAIDSAFEYHVIL